LDDAEPETGITLASSRQAERHGFVMAWRVSRFVATSIDEVRISNVARSDEWLRAQYSSSANSFVTQGDEEQVCP